MRSTPTLLSTAALALALAAACGGKPKSGLTTPGKHVPPPPDITNIKPDDGKGPAVSEAAQSDFASAADFYAQQDKAGWTEATCRQAADKFAAVVATHHDLADAQYMVGRSYHNCKMSREAEEAYQATLKIKPNHGPAISNLGELYFAAGKVEGARKYWESAIKANPKLSAAYVNLAMLQLEELRKTKDASAWKKLEADTRKKLSISLAIDTENVHAYTLYGLVYLEGYRKNRNRLDLAKLLLEEGEKRDPKYAQLQHAFGLLNLAKNNLTDALQRFQAAVELDGEFAEARQNVGLISLGVRRFDVAKEQFEKVLSLEPKNYDAMIGLGIALRGTGDLAGAEAMYKKAMDLDPKRGDAYFNLGVLYKEFRATKENDLRAQQEGFRTARKYFQDFLGKDASDDDKGEAKELIAACDKVIKQIDDFIKAMANQPGGGGAGGGASGTVEGGGGGQ